ncbi:MAG: hypothetical protein ACUVR3_07850, partial [Candidatus Roseilinea sp.]
YSIGVILYEMLGGRLPFDARDAQELARLHLNAEPTALHLLNPNVTLQLEAIVRRALAKDPAQRYRDADQLARVLVAYLPQGAEQTLSQPTYATVRSQPIPLSPSQSQLRAPASSQSQPRASRTPAPTSMSASMSASQGLSQGASAYLSVPSAANAATTAPRAEGGTDLLVWLLGAVAVLCVLGLIPLYAFVLRAYSSPAAPASQPGGASVFTPTIVIAGAPETLILPSFVGLSLDEARQGVSLLGLESPAVEIHPDPDAREPLVFAQRPPPGAQVPRTVSITFAVSMPAVSQQIPVDLVGRTLDDSLRQTLDEVGWNVVVSESIAFEPENVILTTDPPPGSRLVVSGTLTVTVSTGGRVPINANLSPIALEWARFSRDAYLPGQTIQFSVNWRALATVNKGYKVGWYLLSETGDIMAQGQDREPRHNGNPSPTSTWRANTVVFDTYSLVIPAGLAPGIYQVGILLYDDQGRLPVLDPGKASVRSGIVLLRAIQVQ